MLKSKSVFITGVTLVSAGKYSFTIYTNPSNLANNINNGDVITDKNQKRFEVTDVTSPLNDGDIIFVLALDGSAPTVDTGYDSYIETPGQQDNEMAFKVTGEIWASEIIDPTLYKHSISVYGWNDYSEVAKLSVTDEILDSNGRAFVILEFIGGPDDAIIVEEKEKIGTEVGRPIVGPCTAFRPTENLKFYRGDLLEDPRPTQFTQNRDLASLDKTIGVINTNINNLSQSVSDLAEAVNEIENISEIIEVANYMSLPVIGQTGKIYITLFDNKLYRWSTDTNVYILLTSNIDIDAIRDELDSVYEMVSRKGQPQGYAPLDDNALIAYIHLPPIDGGVFS